ncbi:MAG TPA: Ig-like domain-containing protein [Clostridiales bacterium]|jgi:uncharacterized protein YjdB|nr:Ig-like domain-containing protein [Clostridiales bacterium]HOJ35480.1 Ig-like domain-containing protein [Clostridiales bacterium]HOL79236.1 Ig-like domain-containing protein [Clostridiales bacterium]HPP68771.1 Ig-like domain-containing protein [Clostridiales bacterium]HPU67701.1 Ig-like domain-containing protein [Clostridiales bacterium]
MSEQKFVSPEVTRAGKLADKIEASERLQKRLVRVVFILLTLIFIGFLVWGINKVLLTEGSEPMPETDKVYAVGMPESDEKAIALFQKLVSDAADHTRTKLSVKTSLKIDDDSLTVSGDDNELIKKSLIHIKNKVLDGFGEYYPEISTSFGEQFADKLLPISFIPSDLKSWKAEEDGDNIILSFEFSDAPFNEISEDVKLSLGMDAAEGLTEYAKTHLAPVFQIKNISLISSEPAVSAKADRVSGKLSRVEYNRNYKVELSLLFGGDLKSLGEREISFDFYANSKYDFTWAGLELADKVMWLQKGKTDVIEARRIADEDVEVQWSSSDESIVSVDSEGYIKGHKTSPEPVTITAAFTYLGKTYTDECLVYVVVPVKDAKLNTRELTLKKGDTYELSVEIKPKKATVKAVRWFTTDESVAAVDQNGLVTAVGKGECRVYCITENMNLKRSCAIKVEE